MINPSNLLYGVALFLIGQIAVWYQTNGQFLSQWVKEHPFVISLLGVPISYIYIYGSYHLVKAFEGEIWPQRLIGFAIVGSGSSAGTWPVISVCAPNSVLVHPHYHTFKSLPMKLMEGENELSIRVGNRFDDPVLNPHDAVRAVGARNNFANVVLAQPVKDSTTPTTVIEKFGGKCDPLVIDNGSWGESNRNDDKPIGEGVGTSNYTPEDMMQRIQSLEKQLEQMYVDVKRQLENPSSQNPSIT